MHASLFTDKNWLEVSVKVVRDSDGEFPTIQLVSGTDRLVIFPSFRQVHQLHAALENLLMEMEPFENE